MVHILGVHIRSRRLFAASATTFACALAVSTTSFAEPPPPRPVDRLMEEGEDHYREGRVVEALRCYREAWKLEHAHDLACNIGRLESEVGNLREATEFLARCVERAPPAVTPEERRRQEGERREFEAARREVATLSIDVSQPGAEVRLDGVPLGRSPLPALVFVAPGRHRISAALQGHAPAEAMIEAKKGDARIVKLSLPPEIKAPGLPAPRAPSPPPSAPQSGIPPLVISGGFLAGGSAAMGAILVAMAGSMDEAHKGQIHDVRSGAEVTCASSPSDPRCEGMTSAGYSTEMLGRMATFCFIAAGVFAAGTLGYALVPLSREPVKVLPAVSSKGLVMVGVW